MPGCHTQAKTLDGLMERIKEAIELYLEVEPEILQKEMSMSRFLMTRLRPLPFRKVVKILEELGFQCVRQKGSHLFLRHPDGRTTFVPIHKKERI